MALESYDGHVEDVDVSLWRGAYRLDGIRIVKTGSGQPTPFFASDRVILEHLGEPTNQGKPPLRF